MTSVYRAAPPLSCTGAPEADASSCRHIQKPEVPVDMRFFAYARQLASLRAPFNPRIWADALLWPRAVRRAPVFWTEFCRHWEIVLGLPKGLNGSSAAAVLHVITAPMTADGGDFNCFLTIETISSRAHVGERVVQRVLAWQRDADLPLIAISRPGRTRGMNHLCHRFSLVLDPPAFAAARDAARAQKIAEGRKKQAAQHLDRLEDQKQMFLGRLEPSEYELREARREADARGDLPPRVELGRARKRGASLAPIDIKQT